MSEWQQQVTACPTCNEGWRPIDQPACERCSKGWQPIETAPKDGTRILLYQEGRGAFEGWWKTDWPRSEAYWMDDADSEPEPTYWQPLLPAPPSRVHAVGE